MIRAQTERLILRDITQDDAAFMLAILNDPGWLQFIGDRGVRTLEDAQIYITDKIIKAYIDNGFGMFLVATRIADKSEKIIGTCGLVRRAGMELVDLGFAFLQPYCGQGYGYESAMAVIDLARTQYKLPTLAAITDPENIVSQKLLVKLGMEYKDTIVLPNIEGESWYYELDLSV